MSARPRTHTPPLLQLIAASTLLMLVWQAPATGQGEEIAWEAGPGAMMLGSFASIWLPEGYIFAGAADTKRIMELTGNPPSDQEVGLVAPIEEEKEWFIVFEYFPVGHVKDDDRDQIDAEAMLEAISRGTEEANKFRKKLEAPSLHVLDWYERPHYDTATHNLVWALEAVEEGAIEHIINYNVRLLGRRGYMSITLVTEPNVMAVDKPEVEKILAGFAYHEGSRYADFLPGDKVAQVGLAALVAGGAGVAAVKLGLFAGLAKFLGKAWKIVVLAFVAVAGVVKKFFQGLFGRRTTTLESL